ncbi:MAG: MBL fold metallo-hydrolase [bacterium]
MNLTIHRGTKQIGGSCVEVRSGDDRILLDLGLPLTAPGDDGPKVAGRSVPDLVRDGPLPGIAGVYIGDSPGVRAVVLSHVHQDHTGLAGFVHPDIPVFATAGTWALVEALAPFVPDRASIANRQTLHKNRPRNFGELRVTAIPVDHSAPDAAAIYVEGGGRRLLYTGDLRAHGKKGYLYEDLMRSFAGKVDTLLVEGTTVGRPGHACQTEKELEAEFESLFRSQKSLTLVFCSGQNLDRIVIVYRAAKKTGMTIVIDLYTAYTLHKLGCLSKSVPQWHWQGIKVIAWPYQEQRLRKAGEGGFVEATRPNWTSRAAMKAKGKQNVLLMRSNRMMTSLEAGLGDAAKDVQVIWSMWDGYWKHDKYVRPFCERYGIEPVRVHTSGHASWDDLVRLIESLKPETVVPVHTENAHVFTRHFSNTLRPGDGEPFHA